mmetsp:Transcript_6740/g.28695  ORF Transcript_6740/g.28695 Transcript_6740/m.28695 type:complete len:227 (+) Transcript_6740:952-1632(+)
MPRAHFLGERARVARVHLLRAERVAVPELRAEYQRQERADEVLHQRADGQQGGQNLDRLRVHAPETLHGGGARDAATVKRTQRRRDLRPVRDSFQDIRQLEPVLERQTRALADVGHRRVARVAQERRVAICPRFADAREPVPQVSLLNLARVGCADELQHLRRPAFQRIFQERARVGDIHGVGSVRLDEAVPLHAPRSVRARHEVMIRTDERAVPDVFVIVRLEER